MEDFSILNLENYKKKISTQQIANSLIKLYTTLIGELLKKRSFQSSDFFFFIIKRGLKVLFFLFSILLCVTKNTNLAIYHCEKAVFYYIEFIYQISDNTNFFIKLNSTDAAIFIYKKTIFNSFKISISAIFPCHFDKPLISSLVEKDA